MGVAVQEFRIIVEPDGEQWFVRGRTPAGSVREAEFIAPPSHTFEICRLAKRALQLRTDERHRPAAEDSAGTNQPRRDLASPINERPTAVRVGTTLSASLLTGEVGTAYDAARRQCRETGRRLRLTLSLSAAPELFAIPWELMYHHTGFLGCQRDTPLVRHLAVGEPAPAPAVEQRVRMLVVIASPTDLPGLDTDTEVRIIEAATESVVKADRLEIDWLVGATLPALHQKLRDHSYHLLHVVAHGGPGPDGAGALYLQDARSGSADEVSTATLRTLLDLQRDLRVVVLNSCHGARSGTDDPTRHLVAALIERGVPAVVGMQFPISDRAALTFADEFYRHLIGAQEPIDAAVAAARLAIMVNVDQLEWATPVLYVRDPNVELFRFFVAALVVPPLVEIGRHLTSHHAAPAVTRRVTRLVAARPRGIAPLLVAGAAALGAAAVWADDGPALAGSWRTDAWTQVSASGLDTANPLDSYEVQFIRARTAAWAMPARST